MYLALSIKRTITIFYSSIKDHLFFPSLQIPPMALEKKIDIEHPRYDQSTFVGRAKHFLITTNPLNVLASDAELDHAKNIVEKYR